MKNSEVFDPLFRKSLKIFIGVVVLICSFPIIFTTIFTGIDFTHKGAIGDTIGGTMGPFIAIAAAVLTFLAFWIQYKANEIQIEANSKQDEKNQILQFENRFFELLRLHRANIEELSYAKFNGDQWQTAENRKVFREIYKEFIECYREVKKFSNSTNPDDYLLPKYQIKLKKIIVNINPHISIIEMVIIDIAYSIIFFGIGIEGEAVLRHKFLKKCNNTYLFRLLTFIKMKPKKENILLFQKWQEIRKLDLVNLNPLIEEIYILRKSINPTLETSQYAKDFFDGTKYKKYYGGHQHRLGHYFRHLFQSYKFLNSFSLLKDEEKYFFGKTLRAQLSTYEQVLLFFNSISSIGWKWEFSPDLGDTTKLSGEEFLKTTESAKLITKYQLIKNIPDTQLYGIKCKSYYPKVKFESEESN